MQKYVEFSSRPPLRIVMEIMEIMERCLLIGGRGETKERGRKLEGREEDARFKGGNNRRNGSVI